MTGYVTWQSALGHKATGAASLTVGGHMTGYVTWQSALGHKATDALAARVAFSRSRCAMRRACRLALSSAGRFFFE